MNSKTKISIEQIMSNAPNLGTLWTPKLLGKLNAYKLQTKVTGISTMYVFMEEITKAIPTIRFHDPDGSDGDTCRRCYFHRRYHRESNKKLTASVYLNCDEAAACSKIDNALGELFSEEDIANGEVASTYYVKGKSKLLNQP